jgi:hypothetical protein
MCIHPLFMSDGKLEARALAIQKVTGRKKGICEYAFKGCDGAKDGETYRRYCDNNGELCSKKFRLAMEETER